MLSACRAATSRMRQSHVLLLRPDIRSEWVQGVGRPASTIGGDDSHDDFKPVRKEENASLSITEHIKKDIKDNPVMVYMKGVPDAPQCGFSMMVVRILKEYGVQYKARNVLADQELRDGIKSFSKWPTIPQVYINGEFVGGSDILMNLHKTGELQDMLKKVDLE